MECSSWEASNHLFASVSHLPSDYLHWIVVVSDFSHWRVQLYQSFDVFALALLIEYSLDLCQESLAHPTHAFSQSEAINVRSLKPNVKLHIGKRLSSVGKQLKDTELIRAAALKRGRLFSEQIGQELILDFPSNEIQSRHLVIFLIKLIQLFQLLLRYALILFLVAQVFVGFAQMLEGLHQFHDLRLVALVVVA